MCIHVRLELKHVEPLAVRLEVKYKGTSIHMAHAEWLAHQARTILRKRAICHRTILQRDKEQCEGCYLAESPHDMK